MATPIEALIFYSKPKESIGAVQLPSGTKLIEEPQTVNTKNDVTIIYSRVSSSENKSNLDSQADRCAAFCAAKGWPVNKIVKECASGMNDSRPKLQSILKDKSVTRIVVEHKDRLTRFGFEYIKTLFNRRNYRHQRSR